MDSATRKKLQIIGVVVLALTAIVIGVILYSSTHPKGAPANGQLQTGGDYSPDKTEVVFHDSKSIYNILRSEEMDTFRRQLADVLEKKFGAGHYTAAVIDDKVTYIPSQEQGIPPSFWFEVNIDKKNAKYRVDADMSAGSAKFTISPETL